MIIKQAELETVCGITSKLPENAFPEVAFAGKSNVGKSSLINGLLNRKSLARTSSQPGKTQTINFYKVNGDLYLVDLPGYGYAKISKKEQEKLQQIISSYILCREQMTNLFVLVDSRHEPQKIDMEFIEWLGENGIPFSIVFTKADKSKPTKLKANIDAYLKALKEQWEELPPYFITSSENKTGRTELLNYIESINKSL